jgi:4-diphosphocytidyl-2-C-methyl-D-erythritol kinase
MTGSIVVEHAPAKINLTLEVLGRRADGYHELASLVVFARDAADTLTIDQSRPPSLSVSGLFGTAIEGTNIVSRAVDALGSAGVPVGAVELDKRLPIAAGIGGGSADAAALIRAVRRAVGHWDGRVPWEDIAQGLGADVPVCLAQRPAWMRGAGECVDEIVPFPVLYAVLVNPQAIVPPDKTARVFRALGLTPGARLATGGADQSAFGSAHDVIAFVRKHSNALTEPACSIVPAIRDVLAALEATVGCRVARMSGAGPTCFGIFDDLAGAAGAARELEVSHPSWWVQATHLY